MTATLFLARHASHGDLGRVLSGRGGGGPLSSAGREQAERLAERLAKESLTCIQSSPQQRALETAAVVAERTGLGIEEVSALDEIEFGDWTGLAFEDLANDPAWGHWNQRRGDACPPRGESMAEVAQRTAAHLERLARSEGERVLCVSHCDVIRATIAHHLGLSFDHVLRFNIDPAALSILYAGGWGASLITLNERCGS